MTMLDSESRYLTVLSESSSASPSPSPKVKRSDVTRQKQTTMRQIMSPSSVTVRHSDGVVHPTLSTSYPQSCSTSAVGRRLRSPAARTLCLESAETASVVDTSLSSDVNQSELGLTQRTSIVDELPSSYDTDLQRDSDPLRTEPSGSRQSLSGESSSQTDKQSCSVNDGYSEGDDTVVNGQSHAQGKILTQYVRI